MVVYDVTSEQSLKSCTKWLERVKAQKAAPELELPGLSVKVEQYNYECYSVCLRKGSSRSIPVVETKALIH